jgi:acetyl-CoA/propionyl-CoA carboxylase carboxyl transferase subunit
MTTFDLRRRAGDRARNHRDPAVPLGLLFDEGSVSPASPGDDSEVSVARGRIDGLEVIAYRVDALGATGTQRIVDAIDAAVETGSPVIGLWHSAGLSPDGGVDAMDGAGRMFAAMTRASGVVPQISIVLGPAEGAAAYGPALTDVVIMAPAGRLFVTGPDVVRTVTREPIDSDDLGGAKPCGRSGVAHLIAEDEVDACERARRIVRLLAEPGKVDPELVGQERGLWALLPDSPRRAYDVRPLVSGILDEDSFEELQPGWAPNMVAGLGRFGGGSVGVLANNPLRKGGCLDALSAEKAARFVRFCDCFGIPLLVIVDVIGHLPGVGQEWDGVVRRGAKLVHAFAEAQVPRVTLITRKSYGGAYLAMNSRSLGATAVFAWPQAEIGVMGAEAAVSILHREALDAAPDENRAALLTQLVTEHERASGGVTRAKERGVVDEVIDPADTRRRLAEAFATASSGRGRHGNIPL